MFVIASVSNMEDFNRGLLELRAEFNEFALAFASKLERLGQKPVIGTKRRQKQPSAAKRAKICFTSDSDDDSDTDSDSSVGDDGVLNVWDTSDDDDYIPALKDGDTIVVLLETDKPDSNYNGYGVVYGTNDNGEQQFAWFYSPSELEYDPNELPPAFFDSKGKLRKDLYIPSCNIERVKDYEGSYKQTTLSPEFVMQDFVYIPEYDKLVSIRSVLKADNKRAVPKLLELLDLSDFMRFGSRANPSTFTPPVVQSALNGQITDFTPLQPTRRGPCDACKLTRVLSCSVESCGVEMSKNAHKTTRSDVGSHCKARLEWLNEAHTMLTNETNPFLFSTKLAILIFKLVVLKQESDFG